MLEYLIPSTLRLGVLELTADENQELIRKSDEVGEQMAGSVRRNQQDIKGTPGGQQGRRTKR